MIKNTTHKVNRDTEQVTGVTLKSANGDILYPYTISDNVKYKNGDNLSDVIINLENKTEQALQQASNGKKLIAQAITGKNISASANDSFSTLADKISSIPTGPTGTVQLVTRVQTQVPGFTNQGYGTPFTKFEYPITFQGTYKSMIWWHHTSFWYVKGYSQHWHELTAIGLTNKTPFEIYDSSISNGGYLRIGYSNGKVYTECPYQKTRMNLATLSSSQTSVWFFYEVTSDIDISQLSNYSYREVGPTIYYDKETGKILGTTPAIQGYFEDQEESETLMALGIDQIKRSTIDKITLSYEEFKQVEENMLQENFKINPKTKQLCF